MSIAPSPTSSPIFPATGPGFRKTSQDGEAATPAGGLPFPHRDGGAAGQYYVAVDRPQHKMGTLLDLLEVLARRGDAPVMVACTTRDVLDQLAAALSAASHCKLFTLHSDQGETERTRTLASYKEPPKKEEPANADESPETSTETQVLTPVPVLLSSDACLPGVLPGEASAGARLLCNYDLPANREAYLRRIGAAFHSSAATELSLQPNQLSAVSSAGSLAVSFVVAPEVRSLRNLEEALGMLLEEMPIHISDLVYNIGS